MLGPILPRYFRTVSIRAYPRYPDSGSRINTPDKYLITILITSILITMSLGCVRSVPLTAPKLPGLTSTVGTPATGTPSASTDATPLPTAKLTAALTTTPAPALHVSQKARSGSDCQISLLGTFPLNEAPSISHALENAGLTLTSPALQFTEEYLFLGIISRNCIVVFTDESP